MTSVENGASPAENLLLLKLLRFVGIFSQEWKGIRGLALALLKLCIGALPVKLGLLNKRALVVLSMRAVPFGVLWAVEKRRLAPALRLLENMTRAHGGAS